MNKECSFPRIHAPIAALLLFQIAALFARSFLQVILTDAGYDSEVARNLSYLVVPIIEVALMWPIAMQNRQALRTLLRVPRHWFGMIVMAMLLGLAARLCGWSILISATSFGWFGFSSPGQGDGPMFWIDCPAPSALILSVLVTAALIPLGEELINRGLILGTLIKNNRSRAVVVSAGLFAVLHVPAGIPAAFCIGILLAIQTCRYQSLVPSIITHATYNLLRILDWFCLHGIWNPEQMTDNTRNIGIASLIVAALSLTIAVWLSACTGPGRFFCPGPEE